MKRCGIASAVLLAALGVFPFLSSAATAQAVNDGDFEDPSPLQIPPLTPLELNEAAASSVGDNAVPVPGPPRRIDPGPAPPPSRSPQPR